VVIDYELPAFTVVPQVQTFKYVKTSDSITHTERKIGERRTLYADAIAAITLRTLHEVFTADTAGHIDVVAFNGYVRTIDPGTGKDIQPYLITVRATRDAMQEIDLSRVASAACLQHLKAEVSRSPETLAPVRPIVDFNMVDPRFVEYGDVLSTLDRRPNLMEMSPGEFETLVTNLFGKMGLETKLTQPSRDGGVDCVAFDQRPILGGKVVIQAKRYRHTVGVSAVRDLYGTMMNEHANKGILVTTSGYGKAAYDFANAKPIELINGSNLLYLLEQQGVEAKIEVPDDWQDPVPAD
jgi:restriction system protein